MKPQLAIAKGVHRYQQQKGMEDGQETLMSKAYFHPGKHYTHLGLRK